MPEDEYEILPHQELQKLREEVEELKRNPMGNIQESEDLKTSMGKLTRAMHHLIEILTRTNDEMVSEFKRTTISEHFQQISDQNEKIATALLGMAQLQEHPQLHALEATNPANIPGMMNSPTSIPNGVDMPFEQPAHQPTPGIQEPLQSTPSLEQPMNTVPATDSPNSQLPGLDIPPPEHHRKGLAGLFKK